MSTIFDLIDAGDTAGLEELLEREPSAAAARDEQGLSPFMRASYRGNSDAVSLLHPVDAWDRILAGASDGLPAPDAWSPDGFTPLHLAVFARNAAAAHALLDAGADVNAIATASFARVTPLGTAAAFGVNDIAQLLLEAGADVDATADHGFTPLHAAASNGNGELVELLLAHGANRDARNENGQTPVDLAPELFGSG
jgi:ankyrin repeat protein